MTKLTPSSKPMGEGGEQGGSDVNEENTKVGDIVYHNGKAVKIVEFRDSRKGGREAIIELPQLTKDEIHKQAIDILRNRYKEFDNTDEDVISNHRGDYLNQISDISHSDSNASKRVNVNFDELSKSQPTETKDTVPKPNNTNTVDWAKDIENVDLSKVDWKNPTTEESIAGHENHIKNDVKKGQQSLLPKIRELAKKYNLTKEQYLKVLPSIRQVLSNAEPNINSIENIILREGSKPQPIETKDTEDWSRDVESTAKALGGVQKENADKFVNDFANIDIPFRQKNIQAEMDSEVKKQLFPNEKSRRKYAETIYSAVVRSNNFPKILSEAYHKAKKDGSNPELVKAVEDLINKNESNRNTTTEVNPKAGVSSNSNEGNSALRDVGGRTNTINGFKFTDTPSLSDKDGLQVTPLPKEDANIIKQVIS